MKEYELLIESYNPCGGAEHGQKEFCEIEIDDPMAYVKQHANVSEAEIVEQDDENITIVVNQKGYVKKYYFTEI